MKSAETERRMLLIGLGSTLRGDDALGPKVAEHYLNHPHVHAVMAHGLFPEHAELLARYDVAVIVDASCDGRPGEIQISRVERGPAPFDTHDMSIGSLLALAHILYGRVPHTLLITVAAEAFEIDRPLSESAKKAMTQVIAHIEKIIQKSRDADADVLRTVSLRCQ